MLHEGADLQEDDRGHDAAGEAAPRREAQLGSKWATRTTKKAKTHEPTVTLKQEASRRRRPDYSNEQT